ncbi:MAG: hypothetical protein AAB547_02935 [Patescibacteria group bacterium]
MMNKNIIVVIVIGVVALLGIWWYMAAQQSASDKMMMEQKAMEEKAMKEKDAMKKEESMKKDEGAMMKKDETKSYTVSMKEQNGSKQIGTATIVDVDGKAKVTVKVAAGAKDAAQPAHIHVGACPTPGAVAYPLSAVVNGMSETTLAISTTELMSKLPLAVNVHKSKDEATTFVSCGDIVADAMMKK